MPCNVAQVVWPSTNRVVKDTDLFVGAVVPILKRSFELLDADEFTYQYMENNRQVYPLADPQAALATLPGAFNTGEAASVHPDVMYELKPVASMVQSRRAFWFTVGL